MTEPKRIDLARGLLDHQIVDRDGRRCGKVDDLELELTPGKEARVTALLVGPRYWPDRMHGPFGRLLRRVGGSGGQRIPWEDVDDITSAVVLSITAKEAGLGRGDDRLRPWVERLPHA